MFSCRQSTRMLWALAVFICLVPLCSARAQNAPSEAEIKQGQEGMKQMQEFLNSPEYQKQIGKLEQQLREHGAQSGMDPAFIEKELAASRMQTSNMSATLKMSQCIMDGLGSEGMARLEKQGNELSQKIEALCKAKDAEGAKKFIMDYSAKIVKSDDYKVMRECYEKHKKEYTEAESKAIIAQYGLDKNNNTADVKSEDICSAYQ